MPRKIKATADLVGSPKWVFLRQDRSNRIKIRVVTQHAVRM